MQDETDDRPEEIHDVGDGLDQKEEHGQDGDNQIEACEAVRGEDGQHNSRLSSLSGRVDA